MNKKIVFISILTIFLSLSSVITILAADCSCYCNCLFYNGVTQSPSADCEIDGSHIYYDGKMTANTCKQRCIDENTTWYEGNNTCNSDQLTNDDGGDGGGNGETNSIPGAQLTDPLGLGGDIDNLWIRIIDALLGFVAIASLVTFVYAGFMFLISTGNAERVKKAKDTIIYALLGIFLSIASYSVINFIFKILE